MITFNIPRGKRPRLTETDRRLLAFIREHKAAHEGQAPSIRQIMTALGLSSTSVVSYAINRLIENGYLRKGRGARAISLVDDAPPPLFSVQEVATPRATLVIASEQLEPGKRYIVTISEATE
jgi:SOS-response transcriptional repressor LexA